MTDFLDQTRQEISERLKELKPLVDEYSRLQAAAAALAQAGGPALATPATARSRRRRRGRSSVRRASKAAAAATPPSATAATSPAAPARKKPGRPAGRKKAAPTKGRGGRRKGSGTRAAEALALVQGQPGITIPEIAAKMGINQNYLYRVLPGLEKEKRVEKKGRGWHAKGS